MKIKSIFRNLMIPLFILIFLTNISIHTESAKRPLTFQDIMKFKEIHNLLISEEGNLVAYNLQPDRGNGEVVVHRLDKNTLHTIPGGKKLKITKDGKWLAASIVPDVLAKANKKKKDKLENNLALMDTESGKILNFERVKDFAFSANSKWLVYQVIPKKEKKDPKKEETKTEEPVNKEKSEKKEKKKEDKWEKKTCTLVVRSLLDGKETKLEKVLYSSLDPSSRFIAYTIYHNKNKRHGLFAFDTEITPLTEIAIHQEPGAVYSNLSWSKKSSMLAFITHKEKDLEKKQSNGNYKAGAWLWRGKKGKLSPVVVANDIPTGWMIPTKNKITWSKDENRFFLGLKPQSEYNFYQAKKKDETKKDRVMADLFDPNYILKDKKVDVWHWLDPTINPQQKISWDRNKNRTYTATYGLKNKKLIQLADTSLRQVPPVNNPNYSIGYAVGPYLREMTWNGHSRDVYLINLKSGDRQRLLTHFQQDVELSPGGKFTVYFQNKHWYLHNNRTEKTFNLTASLSIPFYDEDHDYPAPVSGYDIAGWLEGDRAVFICDKYDIWRFDTKTGKALNLTNGMGRNEQISFSINKLDKEIDFISPNQPLLLNGISWETKENLFYKALPNKSGVTQLTTGKKQFKFVKKAKRSNRILFTRESFEEFPDIWYSNSNLDSPQKISHVNPMIKDFLWGKSELIEWKSLDGIKLQGIVIKPENYDKDKRYPVLVYYYRFFSQRLHEFNQMVVNHRPNFPYYTSNGYVVFLPDVRFQIGRPGFSATKCVVPGVQKLIEMGIADPKGVGLHGHSWSGYQTAFVITQTDIFAAAIAGAPVSNMTSAYSGIRWGSGMARQFQYEQSQSRIGPSLYDAPHLYIENSPVFFANRIKTPLLIQHGDKDGAVPWYQSIEMYLAMRRLNKNCVFLQYNNEPHHLKKYANKLDYSIKMKEFLDHYLIGKPAAKWIKEGVAFKKNN